MAIINLTKDTVPETEYDICIVGSGPAGLTLARELTIQGKQICVLESGHERKTSYADKLREVKSSGEISIKTSSRERILGGTSTTWAGLSAPLDEIDFAHWPITSLDLKPYYEKAHEYGFPSLKDFEISALDTVRKTGDISFNFKNLEEKVFIAMDPPWNFGKKLRHIFDLPTADLYLDATVTKINSGGSGHIDSLTINSSVGKIATVHAKKFVIAAGGVESTRLLLASHIGNEHNVVGKYLTNHPKASFGIIRLNKKIKNLPHLFGYLHNGKSEYAGLRLKETKGRSQNTLNSYLRFEPMFPWTDNRGVEAVIVIMKKTKVFLEWWKKKQKKLIHLRDWNETGDDRPDRIKKESLEWFSLCLAIIKNIPAVCAYSVHRLFPKKEIYIKSIRIRNFMDMEPRGENKMWLGDTKDSFGIPLPEVSLTTSTRDQQSLIDLHRELRDELARENLGILEGNLETIKPWPIIADASHHLGGTIMGNDPKISVVDKNLKVHSIDNLYIVSGSVFPTSGCANPTYTICALALRLAEHLS